MQVLDISQAHEIYSVSRLNQEARYLLEKSFSSLWVEGELSNFSAPNSGHWYFSLKDSSAQIRCAMFRPQNRHVGFLPKDGMQVLLKANVSLYEGRGDFQLIVERLEDAGEGRLRQAFEALKKRLAEAGLFDKSFKKSLPDFPKKIGIITSPTGAAIRDILSVLQRRYPVCDIIIYPTLVQGNLAASHITRSIEIANRRKECDLLILARGGGSLEDLWPFNEEIVAHAIHQSILPIVSGVGHEIDFTIADFVADVRAPTPSAAAEIVTPAREELLTSIAENKQLIIRCIKQKLGLQQHNLAWLDKHLQNQHPKRKLAEQHQRLDLAEAALIRLHNKLGLERQGRLHTLLAHLNGVSPKHVIHKNFHKVSHYFEVLQKSMSKSLQTFQLKVEGLAAKLDALSPLATLGRGFAIVTDKDNKIIRDAEKVKIGDRIGVRIEGGRLGCRIEEKELPS